MQNGRNFRGFTLIELLIVIAILGLLSTIITLAMGSARLKGRDAKRMSDLKQIQTALELYYTDHDGYPAGNGINLGVASGNAVCLNGAGFVGAANCAGTNPVYMGNVPHDPTTGRNYVYSVASSSYSVSVQLEGNVNGLSGNIQLKPSGIGP